MAACGTCGKEGVVPGQACPQCGAMAMPDLELNVRAKPPARPSAKKKEAAPEASLELAVDPRALMQERAGTGAPSGLDVGMPPAHGVPSPARTPLNPGGGFAGAPAPAPGAMVRGRPASLAPASDLEADARLLADYGDAPEGALTTPLYAWKVLRRQREIKAALAVRKAEALHAAGALDDALVALAERARPVAEKNPGYAPLFEELTRAEDQLRSRDKVLAAEQDAQRARLAQVDTRITKAEGELAEAQGQERAVATELAAAQGALAREEAKIKRAEGELKGAQQKEGAGPAR